VLRSEIVKTFTTKAFPYFLAFPMFLLVAIIVLYPIAATFVLSFQDYHLLRLADGVKFVGLLNYIKTFSSSDFWSFLKVTLEYTVVTTACCYLLGLISALILNLPIKFCSWARLAVILPWILPPVVTALVWLWMYDYQFGVINYLLSWVGLTPQEWLISPRIAFWGISLTAIWKIFPWATMMLLAGLQSIPLEYYEAAMMDGAGRLKQFFYVTLPGLKPVNNVLVVLLLVWNLRSVDYIYVMTGGGPARSMEVLALNVYIEGFVNKNFSYASAIGVILLLIGIVITLSYQKALSKQTGFND
jgi:multiple sugar transport system permease protein